MKQTTAVSISPNKITPRKDEYKRIELLLEEGSVYVKVTLWPWQWEDLVKSIDNGEVRSNQK